MPQLNQSVGIDGTEAGLWLMPTSEGPDLFELDISDAGLIETTLRFATLNPGFTPPRTLKCTDFVAANQLTTDTLAGLDYLAAQSQKIIWNGLGPGVHLIDVLCQGALMNTGLSSAPVLSVPIVTRGLLYTSPPSVSFSGGDQQTAATAVAKLQVSNAITGGGGSGGTGYSVGDILTLSGGTFDTVAKFKVDSVAGGVIQTFHIQDAGKYSVIPANPASLTGGTGTGAKFSINWFLGYIDVTNDGTYGGTPAASLTGGGFATPATLGTPQMGTQTQQSGNDFTTPFNPVTTVKDSVEFTIYANANTTSGIDARICTLTLPAYTHGTYSGYDGIQENPDAMGNYYTLPQLDGVTLSAGDHILLADATPFAGVYKIAQLGTNPGGTYGNVGTPWILIRVVAMDQSSEVTSAVIVNVAEGTANSGAWQCTVTGSFTINVDPITFSKLATGAQASPLYKVTVDYHAIELNFEYVARDFASEPRFIQDEYSLGDDGLITIDASMTPPRKMKLDVDSTTAVTQISTTDPTTGAVTVTDGAVVFLDDSVWRPAVKYVGTAAQFEQTPAGAMQHVKE